MGKLKNKRHELFCKEYIIDFNGTRAALACKYSEKSARSIANKLLTNDDRIQRRINELKSERIKRLGIDADYVLLRLYEIDQMDVADIRNDDDTIKPIKDWPLSWRQFISGLDIVESKGQDGAVTVEQLKKIKWPDKVKNLELLGKHVSVMAYKESRELTGANGGPIEFKTASDDELNTEIERLTNELRDKQC